VSAPGDLLALARATAAEAGALAVRMRTEGVDVAGTKSSPTDVVTRADQAVEALIRDRLLGARPDDAFFGEESSETDADGTAGTSGIRWVVDPIDGTVNYLYGLPHYAVSIAAMRGDRVLAGVVLAPALEVEYVATAGGGAARNDVPLPQREAPALDQALVASGYSYEQAIREHQAGAVARMLPRVRDIRRIGSCALDLCAVADGSLDAYVEEGPHLWDHAAAGLVATECGGRIEVWPTPRGKELVLCAPLPLWTGFEALVRSCGFL
jgi:myo-inositol-1(or 4)-monophosphatase